MTRVLSIAFLFSLCVAGCVVEVDPGDTQVGEIAQAICNPNNDTCPGGHPITRADAEYTTGAWEHQKLAAAGHPDVAYSTSCSKSGATWTCTSTGDPIWPEWPGGNSHWIKTTCEVSTSGGNCYSLDCYYGGDGGEYCSPA